MTINMVYCRTMIIVNVAEAKARLAEILKAVEAGETVLLARRNRPIAELRPVSQRPHTRRPYGLCRGAFELPEDFNEPLPVEVLNEFEGR